MIDDILLQEICCLKEQLKIAEKIIIDNCPEMNMADWRHSLGTCDFQNYIEDLIMKEEQ